MMLPPADVALIRFAAGNPIAGRRAGGCQRRRKDFL